ncbi:hypothetical protein HHK36_015142 [Tetracentron sinense]|uniref:RING-type E3 ubiquitin transferase n=1 Tax=Tetracentron sinense TaxID=13715 RepID=A0A834ZAF6_TETSI|nr:hypothetical protein HHK36_015142 [Tetracentron sinense]
MIKKSEQSDRRILTCPAVHPCEGISPATLLHSLITLSRNICSHQSINFATQKRNVREMIRQVGILLIFLEELRDRQSVVPESIVLCFSELHLTFQKIQYLLQDCTREGSRLWILIKSEFISTQFRVLIRTVATALDVLPMRSINVSTEVRELVELVAKQAQKAKFEVDPDDERAVKDVLFNLDRFEKRIVPDPTDLRRILNHLKIQSWNDCNKEIKFFDDEIGLERLNREEKEGVLLSSLMGFMTYCRVVLFDVVEGRNSGQLDGRSNGVVTSWLNPEDFQCPISLELMTDPVTVATGQTYDRSSILKWLKAGNSICPKTGEKLKNTDLVPNSTLRKLIRQFCSDNGAPLVELGSRNRDITQTILAGSPAAAEAMKMLAGFLAGKLAAGTDEEKNKAAYEIRLLGKPSIFNRSCLVEAGIIPLLLNLLSSTDLSIQENCTAALLNLSKHSKSKTVIIENGGLRLILDVLRKGLRMEARQIAAATLFYLSSVEEYRKLIGETPEAIPALVELIRDGTPRGKKNSVVAIFGLLLFPGNHQRVLAAGAVPLLVDLLNSSDRVDLINDSLAVLSTLAEKPDGTVAILHTSALPLIVGNLQSSTSQARKEFCVSLLLSLCINCGAEVVPVLEKNPSLIASLYSLLTEGSSRSSKKAGSLIKILHEFHNRRSSDLITPALPQEQFVHAW